MANVLELKRISKSFGPLSILKGIDFNLSEGQSAAILGPSGAGKSTLLHLAGLMERPSSGSVLISGRDMSDLSDIEKARERLNTIGFLFQFHHLLPDFNVLENVLIPCRLAKDDLAKSTANALDLLERLGMKERLAHKPHQLSGGEQQRVGLARALIRKPKLLLCDEPTGNLDQATAQHVSDLIFSEVRREGVATIVVTHNDALARLAGSAYHLENGTFH